MSTIKTSDVIVKLEEQEEREGSLPPLLDFYKGLLIVQAEAEQRISVPEPSLTREAMGDRIEKGLPLLAFDELELDWLVLSGMSVKVATVFAKYPELFGQLPDNLKESGAGRFITRKIVKAWFKGSRLPVTAVGSVNERLLDNIIRATLAPFLVSYSRVLLSYVEQERWRRRYCPICGGSPDFAFLEKEVGARWLLCSRCDTEWLFQRLECPCCGSQDQNALAYFTDDEGLYRLYVCEQCKQYMKAIDLRQAKSEIMLPLERLLTLDLDSQARENGYKPCAGDNAEPSGHKAG